MNSAVRIELVQKYHARKDTISSLMATNAGWVLPPTVSNQDKKAKEDQLKTLRKLARTAEADYLQLLVTFQYDEEGAGALPETESFSLVPPEVKKKLELKKKEELKMKRKDEESAKKQDLASRARESYGSSRYRPVYRPRSNLYTERGGHPYPGAGHGLYSRTPEQVIHRIPQQVITNTQGMDCQPLHLFPHTTASKDKFFKLQVFKEDGSLPPRMVFPHSMLRHKGSAEQPTIQQEEQVCSNLPHGTPGFPLCLQLRTPIAAANYRNGRRILSVEDVMPMGTGTVITCVNPKTSNGSWLSWLCKIVSIMRKLLHCGSSSISLKLKIKAFNYFLC